MLYVIQMYYYYHYYYTPVFLSILCTNIRLGLNASNSIGLCFFYLISDGKVRPWPIVTTRGDLEGATAGEVCACLIWTLRSRSYLLASSWTYQYISPSVYPFLNYKIPTRAVDDRLCQVRTYTRTQDMCARLIMGWADAHRLHGRF